PQTLERLEGKNQANESVRSMGVAMFRTLLTTASDVEEPVDDNSELEPGTNPVREFTPKRSTWLRECLLLLGASAISQLASIPFYHAIEIQQHSLGEIESSSVSDAFGIALVVTVLIFVAALIGLWAAKRAHLNPLPLVAAAAGNFRERLNYLRPAVRAGIICAALAGPLVEFEQKIFGTRPPIGAQPRLKMRHRRLRRLDDLLGWGILPSLFAEAPVVEEIMFRLLLFSLVALGA